jgi:hypothetical protein
MAHRAPRYPDHVEDCTTSPGPDSIAAIADIQAHRQAVCARVLDRAPAGAPGGPLDGSDATIPELAVALVEAAALLDQEIAVIAARIEELTALGCVRATPYWRKDAHGRPYSLYLIHSTQANGTRQRQYIGADLAKQAQALVGVTRYQERAQLIAALDARRHAQQAAATGLRTALGALSACATRT